VSRGRLYRTEAIVIKRSDFGEADRLLTLYTPDLGKIRVIAKGVRKPTSRKSGHVELFTHAQLLVARGRNLDIVTQAETLHAFRPLREDLLRTTYAYYAAELLDRFVKEGVENKPLFDLLLATLGWLGASGDLAMAARFYELRLLALAGYQPQLFQCVSCRATIEPVTNFFDPDRGGVVCPRCGHGSRENAGLKPISLNALKVLRFLQTRDYETCSRLRISPGLHRELEAVMQRYITYILERNLKSVAFLQTLRRQALERKPDEDSRQALGEE
jgi:DNA repair protein RecO (recombination protein O)